ncbi:hypothetical protein HDU85_000884 [Gaertneriomyces sp. JEL0708]|nr:hypothetical protein HDU85_000884 [Gaertneriomyces sp. JEL0708]
MRHRYKRWFLSSIVLLLLYIFSETLRANTLYLAHRSSIFIHAPSIAAISELLKLIIVGLLAYKSTTTAFYWSKFRSKWRPTLSATLVYAVPAGLYFANQLIYLTALKFTPPAVLHVAILAKFPLTGLLHHFIVRRQTDAKVWAALATMCVGLLMFHLSENEDTAIGLRMTAARLAVMAGLAIATLSAIASVYTEVLLKDPSVSFWTAQTRLCVMGSLFAIPTVLVWKPTYRASTSTSETVLVANGLLAVMTAASGLIVAVILRVQDNLVKLVGAVATVSTVYITQELFLVEKGLQNIKPATVLAIGVISISVWTYHAWKSPPSEPVSNLLGDERERYANGLPNSEPLSGYEQPYYPTLRRVLSAAAAWILLASAIALRHHESVDSYKWDGSYKSIGTDQFCRRFFEQRQTGVVSIQSTCDSDVYRQEEVTVALASYLCGNSSSAYFNSWVAFQSAHNCVPRDYTAQFETFVSPLNHPKQAYVFVISNTYTSWKPEYMRILLDRLATVEVSLRSVGATRQRFALLTPEVPQSVLTTLDHLQIKYRYTNFTSHPNFHTQTRWKGTISKLAILSAFADMSRIIALDLDILIHHNFEELFVPVLYPEEVYFAMDNWPECYAQPTKPNSGLMVIDSPSHAKFQELLDTALANRGGLNGDQAVFQDYYHQRLYKVRQTVAAENGVYNVTRPHSSGIYLTNVLEESIVRMSVHCGCDAGWTQWPWQEVKVVHFANKDLPDDRSAEERLDDKYAGPCKWMLWQEWTDRWWQGQALRRFMELVTPSLESP